MILIFLLLGVPGLQAHAFYKDRIPNGHHVTHPCPNHVTWPGVGHRNENGGGTRNPFGDDFAKHEHKWNEALCRADSDGDGLTNGQELGDPECVWTEGAEPALPSTSHPGVCDPWNSTECKDGNAWLQCGPVRDDDDTCKYFNQPDVMKMTLRYPRTNVPAVETTYSRMHFFDLPDDKEYHLIGVRFLVDNFDVVHHMGIERCSKAGRFDDVPGGCDVITIYNQGLKVQCVDPAAGFRFKKYLSMQIHWTNVDLRSDIYDASGFEVYYTAKLRPHDAAIFTVGQQILNIPPGQTSVVHHGVCSPRCSQLLLKGPIHVTSALNHMHYLGQSQNLTLTRPGQAPLTLTDDRRPTYGAPMMYRFSPPVVINPGDEMEVTCNYQSLSTNVTTTYGETSRNEMCYVYMTVYPVQNLVNFGVRADWKYSCFQNGNVDLCPASE
ncbi:dopamine beta-hydroxylase-like [Littorina saxatilis]|uniref:Temptin n=1 Tax=Littorina saxatilis TaxID=31220 RepID=A0AAN9AQY1_9CAEN